MHIAHQIEDHLKRLRRLSPTGFAVALHAKFASPRYLFQAYEKDWLDHYTREGLVVRDPTILWAFENHGTIRWTDLEHLDSGQIFKIAAKYGLRHGVTVGVIVGEGHSMASFSRSDRAFTDQECAEAFDQVAALHALTENAIFDTPSLHETLRQLSIYLTRG